MIATMTYDEARAELVQNSEGLLRDRPGLKVDFDRVMEDRDYRVRYGRLFAAWGLNKCLPKIHDRFNTSSILPSLSGKHEEWVSDREFVASGVKQLLTYQNEILNLRACRI